MEKEKIKGIIEAILFACGREVKIGELMSALELGSKELINIIEEMKTEYEEQNRGMEIIKVDDSFQLCTKKELHEYIYPVLDKRSKPNLSNAALETLAIIAYNPRITRADIEAIRGVNSDGTIYKLTEYNLIENMGKSELPGRPSMYRVTPEFLKMFGISSLDELPELPRYKLDSNKQIIIDEIIEENNKNETEQQNANEDIQEDKVEPIEAPMPEREDEIEKQEENNKEEE